jgi:hypothetical protein
LENPGRLDGIGSVDQPPVPFGPEHGALHGHISRIKREIVIGREIEIVYIARGRRCKRLWRWDDAMMKATQWQWLCRSAEHCLRIVAFSLAAMALVQCSSVPPDNATQAAPPENYGTLVANNLKSFKGFADYGNIQISGLRWVHAATGWNWLTCVRYVDHGRQRFYAFFISGNAVVKGRYDVRTDRCGEQQYSPLNVTTGAIASPAMSPSPPGTAPARMQGPIY